MELVLGSEWVILAWSRALSCGRAESPTSLERSLLEEWAFEGDQALRTKVSCSSGKTKAGTRAPWIRMPAQSHRLQHR